MPSPLVKSPRGEARSRQVDCHETPDGIVRGTGRARQARRRGRAPRVASSSSVHGALEWPSRTAADEPSSKAPTFATVSADRAPNAGPRDGVDRASGDIPKVHGVMSRPRSLLASACSHGNSTARPEAPEPGSPYPLGAPLSGRGANFSVYSANATGLDLLLFEDEHAATPARVIAFDAEHNRTHHYWHAYVPELRAGQVYAYRADGPWRPSEG